MKKILSLILTTILALSVLPSLVACNPEEPEGPAYSEEFVYNETHHWKPQINGEGDPIEYGEHVNAKTGINVGKCKCGYYFPCHNLVYQKVTLNGIEGYKVTDYDEDMSPNFYHVEVPKFYQGENDPEPLPVISIGRYALSNRGSNYGKCGIKLRSVKLNEGLLQIGDGVFASSDIEEITIPDSVVGELHYAFMQCTALEKIVVGNGISDILGYTFYGLPKCETIILGNSIKEIRMRTFIDCAALKTVVLPSSLVSVPEGSHVGNTDGCEPQTVLLPGKNINVYFNITRDELQARTIPLFPRDGEGNLLNPDGSIAHRVTISYKADGVTINNYVQQSYTTYGLNANWAGSNTVYCIGEWHYDSNGNPVPN